MAKKAIANLTDLVIQNPNLTSLKQFEGLKQQLDESANQCLKIKVTDESSLKVCENSLSKFNDLVKAVEDKHKELKKPHWDNCTAIDGAKNYVLNFEVDPITYLKEQKLEYIRAVEKENKRKKDLEDNFMLVKNKLNDDLAEIQVVESCEHYIGILGKPVNKEKWQELTPQVEELYKNYITLFELKKKELEATETATPDELEAIQQVAEEAKAKIEVAAVVTPIQTVSIGKTRKTWRFEVANINDVPKQWLCVDEEKVKEYMAIQKDVLVDGQVIKGIKFYQQTSVVA